MAYATVAEFREYMEQVKSEVSVPGTDAKIQKVLNRATKIIDTVLGYSFTLAGEPGEQVVYGNDTDYLTPPVYVAGSVALVEAPDGYTVPDYIEQDGMLIVERSGVLGSPYVRPGLYGGGPAHPYPGGWLAGVPYTITAEYGYEAIPDDIVEACLETAVRIWRSKDAGFSDVVGVEGGGAVGYNRAFSNLVREILSHRIRATSPGVY